MACRGINGIVDKNGKRKGTIIIVSSEITHKETRQTKKKGNMKSRTQFMSGTQDQRINQSMSGNRLSSLAFLFARIADGRVLKATATGGPGVRSHTPGRNGDRWRALIMRIEPFVKSRDHPRKAMSGPRESRPLDPHPWSPRFSRIVGSSALILYGGECPGGRVFIMFGRL